MFPLRLVGVLLFLTTFIFIEMPFVTAEGQNLPIWPDLYCHSDYITSKSTAIGIGNKLCNKRYEKGTSCHKFCVMQRSNLLNVASGEKSGQDYEFNDQKLRSFMDSNFGEKCTSDRPEKLRMYNALMDCNPLVAPMQAQLEMNSEGNCGKWSKVFSCVEQAMKC